MAKYRRKKKKRKAHSWRGPLLVLLVLAVLSGAAYLGYRVFKIKEIAVEGNSAFTQEQIVSLSGIHLEDNLFLLRTDAIKAAVETNPYLTLTKVQRVLPDRIILHVEEKKVAAAVPLGGQYAYIDGEGTVLEIANEAGIYPVANGLGPTGANLGETLAGPTDYQWHVFQTVLLPIMQSAEISESITGIELSEPTAVTLSTKQGITIRIGDEENMETKLQWIQTLLPRLIDEGKRFGTLDVTGTTGASFIP